MSSLRREDLKRRVCSPESLSIYKNVIVQENKHWRIFIVYGGIFGEGEMRGVGGGRE